MARNKFNARGSYWCLVCDVPAARIIKGRLACYHFPEHPVEYFDSQRELARYHELRLLERIGEISALTVKPLYVFEVKGQVVGKWKLDFAYLKKGEINETVEDVKGYNAKAVKQVFDLKSNLMKALYGITVEVV